MTKLGVNIDHVATIRQARLAKEPDPVAAAEIAESAGADGITVHLREDRRHINDRDVEILRKTVRTKLNLEMSIAREIVDIACRIRPDQATLVPERRKELTTEGGLDVVKHYRALEKAVKILKEKKISVSIFINAEKRQIKAAAGTGAELIELHTGEYANAKNSKEEKRQMEKLFEGAQFAKKSGLRVNAGHGLNYVNTPGLVKKIPDLEELNIGHSIISRAVLVGLDKAVREMKEIIQKGSEIRG